MTEEQLKEFEKELNELLDKAKVRSGDQPRYVLTGEIIPESLLKGKRDMSYSSEHLKEQK